MDQRAEFDEELEEAWPEEDGLPQNAAEYQRQESVRHLRKENETLRRELKAAQRIQLAALALLLIGVVCATSPGTILAERTAFPAATTPDFITASSKRTRRPRCRLSRGRKARVPQ